MIALVGALRLAQSAGGDYSFAVFPRWELASLGGAPDEACRTPES